MTIPRTVSVRMAQWIRRLPTEQEIHGSSPCMGNFFAIRIFFLMGSGTRNLVLDTHWTCWKFRNRGIELFWGIVPF